MYKTLV